MHVALSKQTAERSWKSTLVEFQQINLPSSISKDKETPPMQGIQKQRPSIGQTSGQIERFDAATLNR
jgi:hypothetical protein